MGNPYKPGDYKPPVVPPRYRIVGDDSGHNYACPVDKVDEFYEWVEGEDCDEPDYVHRIDGKTTFADPRDE